MPYKFLAKTDGLMTTSSLKIAVCLVACCFWTVRLQLHLSVDYMSAIGFTHDMYTNEAGCQRHNDHSETKTLEFLIFI